MSKAKAGKKPGGRAKSGDSSQSFDQKTIQEFKEAFTIMDQNKDGFIDKSDLRDMYASLGMVVNDSTLDEMIKEAPGPINFTVFLTLFGDRLTGTDPEDVILGAFHMFDKKKTGEMEEAQLLRVLKSKRGEPFTEQELKEMYQGNPPISNKVVDYNSFVKVICGGGADELAKI